MHCSPLSFTAAHGQGPSSSKPGYCRYEGCSLPCGPDHVRGALRAQADKPGSREAQAPAGAAQAPTTSHFSSRKTPFTSFSLFVSTRQLANVMPPVESTTG